MDGSRHHHHSNFEFVFPTHDENTRGENTFVANQHTPRKRRAELVGTAADSAHMWLPASGAQRCPTPATKGCFWRLECNFPIGIETCRVAAAAGRARSKTRSRLASIAIESARVTGVSIGMFFPLGGHRVRDTSLRFMTFLHGSSVVMLTINGNEILFYYYKFISVSDGLVN